MIVAKGFEVNARFNARAAGLPDLAVVSLPGSLVPQAKEIEESKFGDKVAEEVIKTLTQRVSPPAETKEAVEESLVFSGSDHEEAIEKMEKYFLQHCWSDGFPLVPPTREAVERMLEGTELARDHVVSLVEPAGGKGTVEKIAINAVMAGCLPQYMPVIMAAFEAITDPAFDLQGIQCTAGLVSPLLIVSGPKLIEQLNINDNFSTIGPGWRANSTIGRAIRLIMINIGKSWPGRPDMKQLGSPFKFVTLMAENDSAYQGAWEPLRVAEGVAYEQSTISVMPAVSWHPDTIAPDLISARSVMEYLAKAARAKYDKKPICYGMENLVLLTPSAFDAIRKERLSRADVQKALYEMIQVPCCEFFEGRTSSSMMEGMAAMNQLEWVLQKCRENPEAFVPLLRKPESLKIVVAGAPGPCQICYLGTWCTAHFVTKAIRLPGNWANLLEKYKGWETPVARVKP